MAEIRASDLKLIQYLNEAYGKEKQLETALEAHIAMTTRKPLRKRMEQHLKETKSHGRDVARRIKQLGGKAEAVDVPGPEAATEAVNRAVELARKGVAALQGPMHVLRGTGEAEKHLRNVTTDLKEEVEEIARYTWIESLATQVGDRETAQLAKRIRRDEERMRDFLAKQIPQLTRAVATEELPAAERSNGRRNGGRRKSASRSASSRSRSSSNGSSRSSSSRKSSTRSRSKSKSSRSRAKASSSRRKS